MRAHELISIKTKKPVRPGRGISAGRGKTAGRGTKGQNSRSGGKRRPGFEGGQNPLMMRIPKLPGFKSRKIPVQTVKLGDLELITEKTVDHTSLAKRGLVATAYRPVKIVSGGQLKSVKTVKLDLISDSALAAIEKSGGSFTAVPAPRRRKAAVNKHKD